MSKPAPARQENRRAEIFDAAVALFRRYGYDGTSMRDIAQAVGVMPASIYYHFPSKESLLLAAVTAGATALKSAVEATLQQELEPWQRLEKACEAHLNTLLNGGDVVRVLYAELHQRREGVIEQDLLTIRRQYEEMFRELINALPLPDGVDRTLLRLTLLGTMAWSPVWYRTGGDSPAVIARGIVQLVRNGCTGAPTTAGGDEASPGANPR